MMNTMHVYNNLISSITNSKILKEELYYKDCFNTIFNANCFDILDNIPDESIDMIFSD